jgi:hypothetical protein
LSDAIAPASKVLPLVEPSTFRYAIAFLFRSSAKCSPHSVEPVRCHSSASQLAKTIDRLGRFPSRASAPSTRASSICVAVPDEGSTAPNTHASR